ncbi:MAG: ligase-associated DNA damage response endonuclease PdeM [Beijerinckiaceae bacterium]
MVIAGVRAFAVPEGALFLPDCNALVVADLHLEKGSAFAARGQMLPPYDTAATLARLTRLVAGYAPRMVIALGDSFHDGRAGERIAAQDRHALTALMAGRDWVWIAGNHDPHIPAGLGDTCESFKLGGLTFRHEPARGAQPGEVAGHLHPAARVVSRSGSVRRRCFVTDGSRCILPAFGAYTGGLNFRSPAFAGLFAEAAITAHVIGAGRVYAIPESRCIAD